MIAVFQDFQANFQSGKPTSRLPPTKLNYGAWLAVTCSIPHAVIPANQAGGGNIQDIDFNSASFSVTNYMAAR